MSLPGGLPKRLSEAVESYIAWRGSQQPVSLKRLVKATGYLMPDLALTEKELSDLIAAKLVAIGCNINFDMNEAAAPLPDYKKQPQRERHQAPINHGTPRSAQ